MKTKVYSKCKRELPAEKFNKCTRNKDGLQNACKECSAAYAREGTARKKEGKIAKENAEFEKLHKIYTNKELAKFTPRELMLELKARGYEGELVYIEHIVKEHRINLNKLN